MSMRYVWRIQGKSLIHNRVRPMFAGYGRLVGNAEVEIPPVVLRYGKLGTRHVVYM